MPNRQSNGTPESGWPTKCPLESPRDGTWKAKAGDPPEHAQDNPPPYPRGSTRYCRIRCFLRKTRASKRPFRAFCAKRAKSARMPLTVVPPGLIVALLLILITSQLFFAFLPYRRRSYIPILVVTALGFGLGQLWDFIGLPSFRLGQANLIPALVFAFLLQPLARFVPRPRREPKEPQPGKSAPRT